jgi:hypothetical protein
MIKKAFLKNKKNNSKVVLTLESNYDNLFLGLENKFPSWIGWEGIRREIKGGINEDDIVSLYDVGLLDVMKEGSSTMIRRKKWKVKYKEGFPDLNGFSFRLSAKGFEYLNNIYSKEVSKRIFVFNKEIVRLTRALYVVAIIQLFFTIFSIISIVG